eukprot:GHVT01049010.1.p1 GENE.GHVT01049010.1~~GHVT01049010.1.p1  ORF type:complete len:183 (-),score=38.91 GHVT01049010.1:81-629(-)
MPDPSFSPRRPNSHSWKSHALFGINAAPKATLTAAEKGAEATAEASTTDAQAIATVEGTGPAAAEAAEAAAVAAAAAAAAAVATASTTAAEAEAIPTAAARPSSDSYRPPNPRRNPRPPTNARPASAPTSVSKVAPVRVAVNRSHRRSGPAGGAKAQLELRPAGDLVDRLGLLVDRRPAFAF